MKNLLKSAMTFCLTIDGGYGGGVGWCLQPLKFGSVFYLREVHLFSFFNPMFSRTNPFDEIVSKYKHHTLH